MPWRGREADKKRERKQTQRIRKSNALLVGRLRRSGRYRLEMKHIEAFFGIMTPKR